MMKKQINSNVPALFDKTARPLSPHLTIYKLPLNAILSISHRATGAALTAAIYGFAITNVFSAIDTRALAKSIHSLPKPVIFLGKLALAAPFTYHTFAGIRHLVWDYGVGLSTMGQLQTSSMAVLGATGISTLALSMQ